MHYVPGLRLRLPAATKDEAEIRGMDDVELGEFAYDYVGIDAELGGAERLGLPVPVRRSGVPGAVEMGEMGGAAASSDEGPAEKIVR